MFLNMSISTILLNRFYPSPSFCAIHYYLYRRYSVRSVHCSAVYRQYEPCSYHYRLLVDIGCSNGHQPIGAHSHTPVIIMRNVNIIQAAPHTYMLATCARYVVWKCCDHQTISPSDTLYILQDIMCSIIVENKDGELKRIYLIHSHAIYPPHMQHMHKYCLWQQTLMLHRDMRLFERRYPYARAQRRSDHV